MSRCKPANQIVFIPKLKDVYSFPNWFVLYSDKDEKPYPVYVSDAVDFLKYSLEPSENNCNTVWTKQATGQCDLIFASCDDPMNTYGRSTEDAGKGENMSYMSARVVTPFGKAFPYIQQQTYTAFKHFGYWNTTATNLEDSFLCLVTFRPVPQSKWTLNKSFGTPLEMIERVIQKDWNVNTSVETNTVSSEIRTLDLFGRLINYSANNTAEKRYTQTQNIFAELNGVGFDVDGKELRLLAGFVNFTAVYPSNDYPGLII